jgi:hypothetical protein
MNILHKKIYLMMYLFSGIFMTNTSYGMDNEQDKTIIPIQRGVNKIPVKPEIQKENSKKNVKNIPEEDLESEYGNISSSTINRPDTFWIDESGKRRFLEAM